eukprot:7376575-Prymnesium_polylepis.1
MASASRTELELHGHVAERGRGLRERATRHAPPAALQPRHILGVGAQVARVKRASGVHRTGRGSLLPSLCFLDVPRLPPGGGAGSRSRARSPAGFRGPALGGGGCANLAFSITCRTHTRMIILENFPPTHT